MRNVGAVCLLTCLFLVSGCSAHRRPGTLDQFYGIPWGTHREAAINAMQGRMAAVIDTTFVDSTVQLFTGGSAFGLPVYAWSLRFFDDKFWCANIEIVPKKSTDILLTYLTIKEKLIQQFGEPDEQDETISREMNHTVIIDRIRNAPTALKVTWKFTRPGGKIPDAVILCVMKGSIVDVGYFNAEYASLEMSRRQSHTP